MAGTEVQIIDNLQIYFCYKFNKFRFMMKLHICNVENVTGLYTLSVYNSLCKEINF